MRHVVEVGVTYNKEQLEDKKEGGEPIYSLSISEKGFSLIELEIVKVTPKKIFFNKNASEIKNQYFHEEIGGLLRVYSSNEIVKSSYLCFGEDVDKVKNVMLKEAKELVQKLIDRLENQKVRLCKNES